MKMPHHHLWRAMAVTLIVLTGCQQTASLNIKESSGYLAPGASSVITMAPTQSWVDSGIDLSGGITYHLTSSGRWSLGPLCGTTEADGAGNNKICSSTDRPVADISGSALVGRFGPEGKPFYIGKAKTFKLAQDERLFLSINHRDWLELDNNGSLRIEIKREGPPPMEIPKPQVESVLSLPPR